LVWGTLGVLLGPGAAWAQPAEEARVSALEARVRALEAQAASPTAGWSNGLFFVRSRDGAFTLFPSARMQVDAYAYSPAFEAPGQPRATVFLRRLRPELLGSLFNGRVDFMLTGDFAAPINNQGTTDAFLVFNLHDWAHVQVGQFDVPFTMENRTSDRVIDFMERSFVVRNLGTAPKEPGLMVWGGPANRLFYYSVGLFNGDGFNVRNLDNAFDVVGRVFLRPFAGRPTSLLARAQLGASFSTGQHRDTNQPFGFLNPQLGQPAGWFSIQSGYPFFRSSYTGADGHGTAIGVVSQGGVTRVAGELNLPLGRFGLRAEAILLKANVIETYLASGVPLRGGGTLDGFGAYGQVSYWPVGSAGMLSDPGIGSMPRVDLRNLTPPDTLGIQLVGRFEYSALDYQPGPTLNVNQLGPSQVAGRYTYWSAGLGANFWWTRHLRLTLNYLIHHIDGATANLPAPGQQFLHELGLRAAVAL
jgi:hypothetical protein